MVFVKRINFQFFFFILLSIQCLGQNDLFTDHDIVIDRWLLSEVSSAQMVDMDGDGDLDMLTGSKLLQMQYVGTKI